MKSKIKRVPTGYVVWSDKNGTGQKEWYMVKQANTGRPRPSYLEGEARHETIPSRGGSD